VAGGSGADKQVVKLTGEWFGDLVGVRGVEVKISGVGLHIEVLADKKVNVSIVMLSDPLGIFIIAPTNRDLSGDSPIVVFVANWA